MIKGLKTVEARSAVKEDFWKSNDQGLEDPISSPVVL